MKNPAPKKTAAPKTAPVAPVADVADAAPVADSTSTAEVVKTEPEAAPAKPKKVYVPDPNEPNWKKVRRQFAQQPEHVQIRTRLERASERLASAGTKHLSHWSCMENGVDLFAEAKQKTDLAEKALAEAAELIRQVPDTWRPGRAIGGAAKPLVVGGKVRLKGRAAKDYPEMAKENLTLRVIDTTTNRAKVLSSDGTLVAVSARDLSAL